MATAAQQLIDVFTAGVALANGDLVQVVGANAVLAASGVGGVYRALLPSMAATIGTALV